MTIRVVVSFIVGCCVHLISEAGAFVLPSPSAAATSTKDTATILFAHHSDVGGYHDDESIDNDSHVSNVCESRRNVLSEMLVASSAFVAVSTLQHPPAFAADTDEATLVPSSAEPFARQGKGFGYTITPPPGFAPGKKPVQTHLDEVNFNLEGVRGYQFGVTVDPVRISTLKEFGTPEEVAARVVTAEVNRDGIFEVTLYKDPVEDPDTGAYAIDYISDGKRGKKHFVTRIFVKDQKLYVLTAQVKADQFADRGKEIMDCVKTFKPL